MAAASYVHASRFRLQAIWYICRRVLTPPQEAHLCTAAVSLGASTDMLCFAEVCPVTTDMQAPALAWAPFLLVFNQVEYAGLCRPRYCSV